jgi:hypothetical protein
MTDTIEDSKETSLAISNDVAAPTNFWLRFAGFAVVGVIAGFSALLGYSTAYCREFSDTVVWTLFIGIGVPIAVAGQQPVLFLEVFFAFLAVVIVAARVERIRFRWAWFALVLVGAYVISLTVTWVFSYPGSCKFA